MLTQVTVTGVARRAPLLVQLYGMVVAELTSTGPGRVTCHYTQAARDQWPLNTALISCSLPLSRRPLKNASSFLRGLLPEGTALAAVAAQANVATFDTVGILARFGRDLAGAAVIAADAEERGPGHVAAYPAAELEADVANLDERPLALHDDSELSLAGLQNKLLLVRTADGWGRPAAGYPSTHILKTEDRRYPGLVRMEAAALALARRIGLTTVTASVEMIADVDCLIVSRFDRRDATGTGEGRPGEGARVHQEDVCQALGVDIDAAERRGKYQEYGGPSLQQAAALLSAFSADPPSELVQLLRATVFTYCIGNGDAHGKNLALLHTEPGVVTLAPLYDTVPTALWPQLPDRAAMSVNGQRRLTRVTGTDLVSEAISWPMDVGVARTGVRETAGQLLEATEDLDLPDGLAGLVRARTTGLLET